MNNRVAGIDGLRGVFAILVLLYHCISWLPYEFPQFFSTSLELWGIYGVEGFFVISGVALAASCKKIVFNSRQEFYIFFVRRYSRILPLYFLMLIGYVVAVKPMSLSRVFEPLMLFGFVDPAQSTLIGGWSIGVEFVFYFLFPIVLLFLRKNTLNAAALFIVSFSILLICASRFDVSQSLSRQNLLYVHPLNHVFFFVCGILFGCYATTGFFESNLYKKSKILLQFLVVTLFLAGFFPQSNQVMYLSPILRVVLSIGVCALVLIVMSIKVGSAISVFLGEVSYGIYLIHPIVVLKILPMLGVTGGWFALTLSLLLSISIAYPLFLLYERPAQGLLRRVARA